MVRSRINNASSHHLLPTSKNGADDAHPSLSEEATIVLTLIDSLPFLSVIDLQEWLPLTADAMNNINDLTMVKECRQRFWDVLNNGEMDVTRAQICIEWWNAKGGRKSTLHGKQVKDDGPFMSGALGEMSKL